MQLLNNTYPGLIIWGTKRGKSVFLNSNLQLSNEELDGKTTDLRNQNFLITQGNQFYTIDQHSDCRMFSLIHILEDEVGRPGFLAVSLVLPFHLAFKNEDIYNPLKQMLEVYRSKYVMASYPTEKLIPDIREDVGLFTPILQSPSLSLESNTGNRHAYANTKGIAFLEYANQPELNQIIKDHEREELHAYERIYLLPKDIKTIPPGYQIDFLKLPRYIKKVLYTFSFIDKDTGSVINDLNFSLNASKSGPKSFSVTGKTLQISLAEDEGFNFTATKPGYKEFIDNYDADRLRRMYEKTIMVSLVKIPVQNISAPQPKPNPNERNFNSNTSSARNTGSSNNRSNGKSNKDNNSNKVRIAIFLLVALVIVGGAIYFIKNTSSGPAQAEVQPNPNPTDPNKGKNPPIGGKEKNDSVKKNNTPPKPKDISELPENISELGDEFKLLKEVCSKKNITKTEQLFKIDKFKAIMNFQYPNKVIDCLEQYKLWLNTYGERYNVNDKNELLKILDQSIDNIPNKTDHTIKEGNDNLTDPTINQINVLKSKGFTENKPSDYERYKNNYETQKIGKKTFYRKKIIV